MITIDVLIHAIDGGHVLAFVLGLIIGGALDFFMRPVVHGYVRLLRGHDRGK